MAQQTRTLTTKEIQLRLKSVSNIAKITKSMKMIASTKVNKATRNMEVARAYGQSSNSFFKLAETQEPEAKNELVIAVSSDRGLCGGIHSSISKGVKKHLAKHENVQLVTLGQKVKAQLSRAARDQFVYSFEAVAKNLPTWTESALIADTLIKQGVTFDSAKIFYNKFNSVISYECTPISIFTEDVIAASPQIAKYEVDEAELKNFEEFAMANSLYWAIAEGYASEMAAKRAAMENATKNADEMIQKLTITYNRSRQAAITNELIDIITGASAM
ncbi:hypothetical protein CXG81DRAFT_29275 [Caulochytrium protostelioides]|uniref:ATP synthase subunit gamma n=1 Tax=Caulochytrium protostelioides TaxID=1555241 RepID=A0A4P9XD60_9FUNG|nr:ATP synthase F1, gamma subunit [Caulochytrium protostelioides]RKP03427.1 hypothetical protein CXG81DRAFT_29275 [Caulochytrium protostelioides]|eukprot:RKP03427.1 hypothetical protein CXG81DRAFT_29275 [Caulochytrium protostelioides]